jgi:hypothetical protein
MQVLQVNITFRIISSQLMEICIKSRSIDKWMSVEFGLKPQEILKKIHFVVQGGKCLFFMKVESSHNSKK